MKILNKLKSSWWQIFIFAEEAYLTLTAFIFFALASSRADVDGPTAEYMLLGYFAAIISSFVSGVILIIFSNKKRQGWIALAFAFGAFALLLLILPTLAQAKRH